MRNAEEEEWGSPAGASSPSLSRLCKYSSQTRNKPKHAGPWVSHTAQGMKGLGAAAGTEFVTVGQPHVPHP